MSNLLIRCSWKIKAAVKVSFDFGEGEGHAVYCCSVLHISKSCSLELVKAVSRVAADHKWDFSHYECIISSTAIVQYSSYICTITFDNSYGMHCMWSCSKKRWSSNVVRYNYFIKSVLAEFTVKNTYIIIVLWKVSVILSLRFALKKCLWSVACMLYEKKGDLEMYLFLN